MKLIECLPLGEYPIKRSFVTTSLLGTRQVAVVCSVGAGRGGRCDALVVAFLVDSRVTNGCCSCRRFYRVISGVDVEEKDEASVNRC